MNDLPLFSYVPYVRNSDTSRAAADSMRPHVKGIAADVLRAIEACGPAGATCDEIESYMGLRHQTISARIKDLADRCHIKDSGTQRKTRSGRAARVYVAC